MDIKTPQFVRENPLAAAVISKLNKSSGFNFNASVEEMLTNLPNVSMSIKDRIKNNANILELFPDIELGIQIIVSSIISPNDMITTSSIYRAPNIKIPPDINTSLTETIKKHINVNYGLDDDLYDTLKETLFTKGATAYAIIPEASLDDIINPDINGQITVESINNFYSKTSLLGSTANITCSVENLSSSVNNDNKMHVGLKVVDDVQSITSNSKTITFTEESLNLQIIDNLSILKLSRKKMENLKKRVRNKIHGYNSLSREETKESEEIKNVLDKLFKNNDNSKMAQIITANTMEESSRKSIGMPMTFKLPVESVIPVYALNDVSMHLGYFIVLDESGAPIDITNDAMDPSTGNNLIQTGGNIEDAKSTMIQRAKDALYGITKQDVTIDGIETLYGEIVESMIKQKLKNGEYGNIVDIKKNADIYRVMFYRSLKAQQTKLLFLPAELVAYYAFEYRDNGSGKSLLEKNAILFSIRAILLFATLMANIKNSITTTEVTADLDEQITDPEKVMQTIVSEVMKTREQQIPIGVTKIDDLVDWIHREGFKFKFNHPGLPNIDIQTSDTNTSKIVPDDTLDESIRDRQYMSFGLTPEILQSGYSDNFATTVEAKNLLFSKRISARRNKLNVMRTSHIRKLIKADMTLREKLEDILTKNLDIIYKYAANIGNISDTDEEALTLKDIPKEELVDYIIDIYSDEIVVELPEAEKIEATNMKQAFEDYKQTLSDYLDIIVSSEAYPEDIVGSLSSEIDKIKAIMKSVLTRTWMKDNGYFPEIAEFCTLRDDGKPTFDIFGDFESYSKTLRDNTLKFLAKNAKVKAATDKVVEQINNATDESSSSDDNTDDNNNSDTNTDTNDNMVTDTGEEDTGQSVNEEDTLNNNDWFMK